MSETAGVIAPPPLIFLAGAAGALLLDEMASFAHVGLPEVVRWGLAAAAGFAGVTILALALGKFGAAKTPPEPWKPTVALATDGIYAHTRNPMYVGMALLLLAIGFGLTSTGVLLLFPIIILVVDRFVIAREERYLVGRFGPSYDAYRRQVRRWL